MLRVTPSFSFVSLDRDGRSPRSSPLSFRVDGHSTYRDFFGELADPRNVTGRLGGEVDLFRDRAVSGSAAASYRRTIQAPFDEGLVPYFNGPRDDLVGEGSLRVRPARRVEVDAGYWVSNVSFRESRLAPYGTTTHLGRASARLALTDATSLRAEGELGKRTFDKGIVVSPEVLSPLYGSEPIRARGGVETLLDDRYRLRALLGYGSSRIEREAAPNVLQFHSGIASLHAEWFPLALPRAGERGVLGRPSVTLDYVRDFQNDYLSGFHTLDRVTVGAEYEYANLLVVRGEASGARQQHPSTFSSDGQIRLDYFVDTRVEAKFFAELRVSENIGLSLTTRYSANTSGVTLNESPTGTPAEAIAARD